MTIIDGAMDRAANFTIKYFAGKNAKSHIIWDVLTITSFQRAPGSADKHHAYTGGLLVHTVEVVQYCDRLCSNIQLNAENLITAAFVHDFMKTRDYEQKDGVWVGTEYRKKIRHVAGSYAQFLKLAEKYELGRQDTDDIGHMILAHHGRKEWGSPVEPQTQEALILHQADLWSALYGPGAFLTK